MSMIKPASVDEYISCFPGDIQEILARIRKIVLKYAPEAEESISYNMPSYKTFGKPLIYFAGYSSHIGLYATPTGHFEYKDELAKYKHGKGSVQFPLSEPVPYDLIRKIVKFRIAENKDRYKIRQSKER